MNGSIEPHTETERRLLARIAELELALEQAQRLAMSDVLTDCLNRRGWERMLDQEDQRCKRHDLDAVVVAIDVDGLKAVNDAAGHAAGDQLLRDCADAIRTAVRAEDTIARPGGDEFAVLAVHAVPDAGNRMISRLKESLAAAGVKATHGCTRLLEGSRDLRAAWQLADQRLVMAKRERRVPRD